MGKGRIEGASGGWRVERKKGWMEKEGGEGRRGGWRKGRRDEGREGTGARRGGRGGLAPPAPCDALSSRALPARSGASGASPGPVSAGSAAGRARRGLRVRARLPRERGGEWSIRSSVGAPGGMESPESLKAREEGAGAEPQGSGQYPRAFRIPRGAGPGRERRGLRPGQHPPHPSQPRSPGGARVPCPGLAPLGRRRLDPPRRDLSTRKAENPRDAHPGLPPPAARTGAMGWEHPRPRSVLLRSGCVLFAGNGKSAGSRAVNVLQCCSKPLGEGSEN